MSFLTVLEKAGEDVVSFFKKALPIAQEVETVAAPIEALVNPALPALIQAGLTAIVNAQALATVAGSTDTTGQVKLAAVISSLASSSGTVLQALGVNEATVTSAQWTTFVNGLVAAASAFEVTQGVIPSVNTNVATQTSANSTVPAPAAVTGAAVPGK